MESIAKSALATAGAGVCVFFLQRSHNESYLDALGIVQNILYQLKEYAAGPEVDHSFLSTYRKGIMEMFDWTGWLRFYNEPIWQHLSPWITGEDESDNTGTAFVMDTMEHREWCFEWAFARAKALWKLAQEENQNGWVIAEEAYYKAQEALKYAQSMPILHLASRQAGTWAGRQLAVAQGKAPCHMCVCVCKVPSGR